MAVRFYSFLFLGFAVCFFYFLFLRVFLFVCCVVPQFFFFPFFCVKFQGACKEDHTRPGSARHQRRLCGMCACMCGGHGGGCCFHRQLAIKGMLLRNEKETKREIERETEREREREKRKVECGRNLHLPLTITPNPLCSPLAIVCCFPTFSIFASLSLPPHHTLVPPFLLCVLAPLLLGFSLSILLRRSAPTSYHMPRQQQPQCVSPKDKWLLASFLGSTATPQHTPVMVCMAFPFAPPTLLLLSLFLLFLQISLFDESHLIPSRPSSSSSSLTVVHPSICHKVCVCVCLCVLVSLSFSHHCSRLSVFFPTFLSLLFFFLFICLSPLPFLHLLIPSLSHTHKHKHTRTLPLSPFFPPTNNLVPLSFVVAVASDARL